MKRELIIINVILALTVIGATVELRTEWVGFETTHSPAGIQFDGEALSAPDEADRTVSPIQDWTAIAEQEPVQLRPKRSGNRDLGRSGRGRSSSVPVRHDVAR